MEIQDQIFSPIFLLGFDAGDFLGAAMLGTERLALSAGQCPVGTERDGLVIFIALIIGRS